MNRIKALRMEREIKQADMARAISVSQAALSGYETGKYEPDLATLKKMADFFDVTVDYLLGEPVPPKKDTDGSIRIPVLGAVPAGIPLEAIEDIEDWEEIPASMCVGGKEYFALRVKGDSMYPDYLPGDVVIVLRTPVFENGDVCVVYVNGYDATLKQVKINDNGAWVLVPRNPTYPPRTYTPQEIRELPVSIAGVVVELRRKVRG